MGLVYLPTSAQQKSTIYVGKYTIRPSRSAMGDRIIPNGPAC